MNSVDIGTDFYHRLANRDKFQGDGKHTALDFRKKYLKALDAADKWSDDKCEVILDFKNVKKIGPSFANEAFAYFTKFAKPEKILKKIKFENIAFVHKIIVEQELDSGYK